MSIYEMVKNDPRFKAYCRRRSTVPMKTLAQRFEAGRKARKAELAAFCKRRGMLSILKENEYTTGGMSNLRYCEVATVAKISKVNGEFVSVVINPSIEEIPDEAA